MARASTDAAHAPSACTARPAISTGSDGAKAQIRLPATNTASPPSTSGARPMASDSGPTNSCPTANTMKKTLSVQDSACAGTPNASAIAGNAGSMMLVASAPSAASPASSASRPALSASASSGGSAAIA